MAFLKLSALGAIGSRLAAASQEVKQKIMNAAEPANLLLKD
jgi:hypothetical protein